MKKFLSLIILFCALGLQAQDRALQQQLRKLQMAEYAINQLYVDSVNDGKLVEAAIKSMLSQLDPHSTYTTPEETKELNEPLNGNFDGIGIQFQMMEDTLLVIQPVSDGPSERVGILAGDRIIAVNDTSIAGKKYSSDDIIKRLRGPRGTQVKLTVLRRGLKDLLNFNVKRDKIPITSIDAVYMADPGIGYIRVNKFAATTGEEFHEALVKLKDQGMIDLILDLQDNGGGYLNAAIDMANEFLNQKDLIVYTEGRSSRRQNYYAKGNGIFREGKLIVLVNEYTASASEIVSGAIQDWDRGLIVGRRSFGKGLVQRPINLSDGSMIRLTTARYYTPTGRCIQKPYQTNADGTKSDSGNQSDYNKELAERYQHGELMHADSIHLPDSLRYSTLKLQRSVYGGGGIMPDYFVPLDTTLYTDYHRQVSAQGLILKTSANFIEGHRKELAKKYKDFNTFNRQFEIDEEILGYLRSEAEKLDIKFNQEQYDYSLPYIKLQLKGLIARDLWDMSEYYHVMNSNNKSVQAALQLLQSNNFLLSHLDR